MRRGARTLIESATVMCGMSAGSIASARKRVGCSEGVRVFSRLFAGEVECPDSDEVGGDEVCLRAGQAFALSEAVALADCDVGFGGLDVDFGWLLVFTDPFAIAEVGTGGLVIEVKLVFVTYHIVHLFDVIGDDCEVLAVLEAIFECTTCM